MTSGADRSVPSGPELSEAGFDLGEADRLLTTTRAVRRRLDLTRSVGDDVILRCIDIAEQAPTGGNDASRRWIVVRDPLVKARLGELYRETGAMLVRAADRLAGSGHEKEQVVASGAHLVDHFTDVPVLVIAAIWGEHDASGQPGLFDSVLQAAWSFNLALRARGLGSAWTTMLNSRTTELAEVLGIPDGVTTVVTFPVAYTVGTDFRRAPRRPAGDITYFDTWGFTRARPSDDGLDHGSDGLGVVTEVDIAARPGAVWPLVTDITLPVRFSDELVAAEWEAGAEPGLGATFTGRNEVPGVRTWERVCHVTAWDPPRVFEWGTVDAANPNASWRFELSEIGAGTRLRFSMRIGPGPSPIFETAQRDPGGEQKVLNDRRRALMVNMQRTIDGVKALAESGA